MEGYTVKESTRVADVLNQHADKIEIALDLTRTIKTVTYRVQASEAQAKVSRLADDLFEALAELKAHLNAQVEEKRGQKDS